MVRIGEDRPERLDQVPARYQVIVTIRAKYACPKGRTGVAQARAPAHLLEAAGQPKPYWRSARSWQIGWGGRAL